MIYLHEVFFDPVISSSRHCAVLETMITERYSVLSNLVYFIFRILFSLHHIEYLKNLHSSKHKKMYVILCINRA